MRMDVTRDVILDLLPLYLADEASADTRVLVEKYLETDPELARTAEQSAATGLPKDMPIPLTKEDAMEAYKKANQWMVIRTLGLAAIIAAAFLCTLLPVMAFVMLYFGR
ncbi:MAG: hypothetical protein ACK2U2_21830 [Anaerolineae bacterium]|jgi:anti-sigma factor RsiW